MVVHRLPPMVPLAIRSRAVLLSASGSPADLLLCSVPNRRTSLKSVHHLCLSLPLGLSLSPLLSCHVHDSPSTRFHLPNQRQLCNHVK